MHFSVNFLQFSPTDFYNLCNIINSDLLGERTVRVLAAETNENDSHESYYKYFFIALVIIRCCGGVLRPHHVHIYDSCEIKDGKRWSPQKAHFDHSLENHSARLVGGTVLAIIIP